MTPQGELMINGSDRVILINSVEDRDKENYMPTFGQLFLSSAYVLVNDDLEQLTLWRNNPTTARNLLAIGESCKSIASSSPPIPKSTTSPPIPKSTNPHRRFGTSTITGIIVGGIAGILLFCGAILMRRKGKIKHGPGGDESQEFNQGILYNKSELPADRHPPQEMPGDSQSPQEMPADQPLQEMPADPQSQEMPVSQHPPNGLLLYELPTSEH